MKKPPVLHPYFFAIYAVLGIYVQNPQELSVVWTIRPLIILLCITTLIHLSLKRQIGDNHRAGLITSLLIAWLFVSLVWYSTKDEIISAGYIEGSSEVPSPIFVFAHMLAPHPINVFNKHGNLVQPEAVYILGDGGGFPGTRAEYEQGYREQITYVNNQMKGVIDSILNNSAAPPIILIQGDHGPGGRNDLLAPEKVECL